MAIRDANRPARAVTGCCADRVSATVGWEAKALFRRSHCWAVVLGDKAPAPVSDGGCLTVPAAGAHHKIGSTKADGRMADGAAYFACGVANEAGRVPLSPDPTDCTTGDGNLCTGAAAAASGQVASACRCALDFGAVDVAVVGTEEATDGEKLSSLTQSLLNLPLY